MYDSAQMPHTELLSTESEVLEALSDQPRLQDWAVRSSAKGTVEVECQPGGIVLAWPSLWSDPVRFAKLHGRATRDEVSILLLGTDTEFEDHAPATGNATFALVPLPTTTTRLALTLKAEEEALATRRDRATARANLERSRYESDLLISVGRSLSQQRDIDSLLGLILLKAREITGADAGSVYIVEGNAEDPLDNTIRFTVSQNDSVRVESDGITLPVSPNSIVGACIRSREPINIPDLYDLDEPGTGNNPWGFVHDRSFDRKSGYQTRSMVTVPMISAREEVIGVIQLINRVDRLEAPDDFDTAVLPFDAPSINFANTLASQAGIALETALLYDEVQTLFEGFVRASVTAIESRDPTTSGHSERVATLTTGLAKAADRSDEPLYRAISFTPDEFQEIEYAALLHDFGKVGVREHVLIKAKKLYPFELETLLGRFAYVRKCLESEQNERKLKALLDLPRDEARARLARTSTDYNARIEELDEFLAFVLKANEPSVLAQGGFERIAEIAGHSYIDHEGVVRPYLTEREVAALQVARGSLTSDERAEIEQHVVHTYNFLKRIPWSRNLRHIPEIAVSHHEKLDGTGYPFALGSESIPTPTRMMTISDIFDALTASDRPYKKAVPIGKALDILAYEVKDGHLDSDLYQLFLDAKIYELVVTTG